MHTPQAPWSSPWWSGVVRCGWRASARSYWGAGDTDEEVSSPHSTWEGDTCTLMVIPQSRSKKQRETGKQSWTNFLHLGTINLNCTHLKNSMRGMFRAFVKTMNFLVCLEAIKRLLGYRQRLILLKLQPNFCQISLPPTPVFFFPPSKPCSISLPPIKLLNIGLVPCNHSWGSSFCTKMEVEKVTLNWQVDCWLRRHQPGQVRAY